MKFCKLLFSFLFMWCSVLMLRAQDIHFSQFYLSPINLNPALTGVMDCNIRLTANYRNQWAAVLKSYAFSTYSVSYDQRIPVGRYDYLGIGGTFWGDKAGEAQFGTTTGKLSFSYSKRMGGGRREAHYLVVGAEGGIAQRSVDFIKLKWPSQYDGDGGYDPTLPTFENDFEPNFIFADMAAGILWFSVWDKNAFYMGVAFHHLNRANQSFYRGQVEDLYSRFTFHIGGEFELSSNFGMVPGAIVMMQGPSMQVNAGTSFRFVLSRSRHDYQAFQVGTWARIANKLDQGILGDAAILSTRFDYNQFTLGFSYDINISDLRNASNGNGSFEFAMQYRFCGPEKRGVYCPKF